MIDFKFGQCLLAYAAMRGEPSDSAEMVSQLYFGEVYKVLEVSENGQWLQIENAFDAYKGWIHLNRHFEISQSYFEDFNADQSKHLFLKAPSAKAAFHHRPLFFYQGALLPFYDGSSMKINGEEVFVWGEVFRPEKSYAPSLIETAESFLGCPYLWGGRSGVGLDCSGFAQLVYRIMGLQIPRDSSQQCLIGETVQWGSQESGDLAFFQNAKGRVTHVGIVKNLDSILHASACVKEDVLLKEGILNGFTDNISHDMAMIKRP